MRAVSEEATHVCRMQNFEQSRIRCLNFSCTEVRTADCAADGVSEGISKRAAELLMYTYVLYSLDAFLRCLKNNILFVQC